MNKISSGTILTARTLNRRQVLCWGASTAIGYPAVLRAQTSYPDKVVKIVVPSAPGGSLDAIARLVAEGLSGIWRQSVYIENRPGANFSIGATYVARAVPDGHTLLYCHDGVMAKNPALYANLTYNPLTDLMAVGKVTEGAAYMLVRSELPYKTFSEFLDAIRKQPEKFNHAAGGPAATFISEYFKSVAKVQYTEVPYKGSGPAIMAVAAGECDFTFGDFGSALTMLSTNRLRILASAAPARSKAEPDVPTIGEFFPTFEVVSWSGLVAPAKTPRAIIDKINADLELVAASPAAQKKMQSLGAEFSSASSPDDLQGRIRNDLEKWTALVKSLNMAINE